MARCRHYMWGRRFRLPARMAYYTRRLPHVHPEGAWLFVTWRLAGALPRAAGLDVLGLASPPRAGRVFAALDRNLNRATCGAKWLADPRIAGMIADTLSAGDREREFYHLRAWVVMPNHVHVLWQPLAPMARITRWVKGSTARKANVLLGRTGKIFWQDESFDHWVRNSDELEKIVRYIERNPVSAGLARAPEDWLWSSARLAGESACPTTVSE